MTALRVACGARRDYAPHAAAMLHSLLASSPELEITVDFLHGPDLPGRHLDRLRRLVDDGGGTLVTHDVPAARIEGLPGVRHIAPTAWYRLLLPELLPDVDRLLYLDVDTIAVRSLTELATLDLEGNYVAATENLWEPWMLKFPAALALPPEQGYFNSGVVVMDLDRIRADGRDAELLDFAFTRQDIITFLDQDVLNAVLGHARLRLHPRFNAMNSVMTFPRAEEILGAEAVAEARDAPVIRHFEGPGIAKPWDRRCPYPDRTLYLEHRRASGFGRWAR